MSPEEFDMEDWGAATRDVLGGEQELTSHGAFHFRNMPYADGQAHVNLGTYLPGRSGFANSQNRNFVHFSTQPRMA